MWVIFHERRSMYTHVDKNVFALVEDKDIVEFQIQLSTRVGLTPHMLLEYSEFLQNFVGNDYFARRYLPMTPRIRTIVPLEPPKLEIQKASLFRDVVPRSPYNTGQ